MMVYFMNLTSLIALFKLMGPVIITIISETSLIYCIVGHIGLCYGEILSSGVLQSGG